MDARLLLELLQHLLADVVAPAVDIEDILPLVLLLGKHIAAGQSERQEQNQQGQKISQLHFHAAAPLLPASR